jgi:putative ABC transport system permease protein
VSALSLALAYLRQQALGTVLTLLLLTLGVGSIVAVLLLGEELERRLTRDLAGIDLVVGAKGSPLQLILSAVYHVDVPTGNVARAEAEQIARHPLVKTAIPLALGDAVGGFRIVGTTPAYVAHYGGALAGGRLWEDEMEAVLGADAAARLGLGLDAEFAGSHGLAGMGHAHAEHPYKVVGVLARSGTVLDRLVLTSLESVWHVHERPAGQAQASEEVTALLLQYRSPLAAVQLPRLVNQQTALQAASPAIESARLFNLLGFGLAVFRGFALLLIATAALGMFLALYNALKERQYDLAVMRALGASRARIFALVLLEGLLLSLAGAALGLLAGHLGAEALAAWLRRTQQLPIAGGLVLWQELLPVVLALAAGALAALPPALRAYRLDIADVLSRG